MSVTSLGLTLDRHNSLRLWASRSEDWACLAIDGGEMCGEIRVERLHLEALRGQLPAVLAGMDQRAAEDAACERAEIAEQRSIGAAAEALDLAVAAEMAGAHEVAAELREYAAKVTDSATAVDAAVRAFQHAADAADSAMDSLIFVTRTAATALRRLRDDDQPAALATP